MSIRASHVVVLQAVIEYKCGEGACLIGVVKLGGRVSQAPRDLLMPLHFNSLKNKLCWLQFCVSPSCDVNLLWLLLGFLSPFTESYFKAGKWSKTAEKKKKNPQRPGTLHTYIDPLPVSAAHSLSLRKQKQATPSDVSFFLSPRAQSCQTLQHFNWFPFSLTCAHSILVHKPRDWISY